MSIYGLRWPSLPLPQRDALAGLAGALDDVVGELGARRPPTMPPLHATDTGDEFDLWLSDYSRRAGRVDGPPIDAALGRWEPPPLTPPPNWQAVTQLWASRGATPQLQALLERLASAYIFCREALGEGYQNAVSWWFVRAERQINNIHAGSPPPPSGGGKGLLLLLLLGVYAASRKR